MSAIARPLTAHSSQLSVRKASGSPAQSWGRRFVAVILLVWGASFATGFIPALAVLSALAFAAAVFGVRRPALGLLGMSMLCTLDSAMRELLLTGGLLRWNSFNYWLLVVVVTAGFFVVRRTDLQSRLLQAFILLLCVELLYSAEFAAGINDVLSFISLFGILIYFARASGDGETLYWTGLVNGVLAAVGGLVYYLHGSRSPPVNPNSWSYIHLTAIFAICLAIPFAAAARRGQLVVGVLAVVNAGWIFLSGSRGALLIVICCLIFLAGKIGRIRMRLTFLTVGVLVGIVLSARFAEQQAASRSRFESLFNPGESLAVRTSGRSELVIAGWMIFLEHPFGIGTGGFAPAAAAMPHRGGVEKGAHSGWIKTLVENGIPGVLLLGAYALSFALDGWRLRRRGVLGLGLFVTATLGVAFLSFEFHSKGLWFLAAGATVLMHQRTSVHRRDTGTDSRRLAAFAAMQRRSYG